MRGYRGRASREYIKAALAPEETSPCDAPIARKADSLRAKRLARWRLDWEAVIDECPYFQQWKGPDVSETTRQEALSALLHKHASEKKRVHLVLNGGLVVCCPISRVAELEAQGYARTQLQRRADMNDAARRLGE